jgi:CRISPR/Cas system endoribonuclease Cas6 (RAMP superfamily)
MKQLLGQDTSGTYTFNPTAKTVTFSGLSQQITLANILLITNVTANTIIYNFASSTTGAVSFVNNVLTLDYDTTSMSATDVLQIYIDVESYEESLATLLRRMNKLLESNAVVDSRLRQKVVIEAIGTNLAAPTEVNASIPVSGTVTATANVNNAVTATTFNNSAVNPYTLSTSQAVGLVSEGPLHQLWRVANDAQACYAQAIRSKLSFT